MAQSTRRCTVQFSDRSFCDLVSADDMPFPICPRHALKLYRRVGELTEDERSELVPTVTTCHPPTSRSDKERRNAAIAAVTDGRPIVYALRCGDGVIKIGHTSDFASRAASIGADSELLAFQVGDYEDEQAIHAALKGYAVRGREWYPAIPKVLAVVNNMRADLGLEPIAA